MSEVKTIRSITAEQQEKYFVDVHGIFATNRGRSKGVYAVSVQCVEGKSVLMYIGETGKGSRCFRERLMEHAYYWLSNSKFYCGIEPQELEKGYKFQIEILAEENDDDKRYRLEQYYVETMRPYMQSGPYPKYDSSYRGFDLCIFPTFRRRAFLFARDGKLPLEEVVQEKKSLVDYLLDETQKFDWSLATCCEPEEEIMEIVKKEMPQGSQAYFSVKKRIAKEFGFSRGRRCYYSYFVKLVSCAVNKVYYANRESLSSNTL